MRLPVIVLNPRDDQEFASLVGSVLDDGAVDAAAMQDRLRERYPDAVVRERGLSHEPMVWYVYRDGAWVPTGDPLPAYDDGPLGDDLRTTAEDLAADAQVFDDLESAKARLDIDDPRSIEVAEQASELIREMAAKTEVENRLLRERQEGGGEAMDREAEGGSDGPSESR